MEKFIAIFAIDGSTSNVLFEVAEKDTIDIRIEYDATNKRNPIKAIVKRHEEDRQPRLMAESDACNTYSNLSQIIEANQLKENGCKPKD